MLQVSKPKYLFDLFQLLLSPSTSEHWPWCANNFYDLGEQVDVVGIVQDFCMERVLLYWSVVKYNNVQEKDRIAQKGVMLPDGYFAMLPDDYITSVLWEVPIISRSTNK